ncbi:MAG TPA: hypothetical protein VGD47_07015 [Steroidobacteraceae bacterium]
MQRARAYRFRPPTVVSVLLSLCPLTLGAAHGQESAPARPSDSQAPARVTPRPDQLEPAVDTTKSAPAAATPAAGPEAKAPGAAPAADAANAAGKPATPGTGVARKGAEAPKAIARKGPDRLELDPTDIKGNRELPKVLYIVPWKRSDLGDLAGKPLNSLLDEVLQPLDRDVFQRENRYYDALKPAQTGPKTGTAPGSSDKP